MYACASSYVCMCLSGHVCTCMYITVCVHSCSCQVKFMEIYKNSNVSWNLNVIHVCALAHEERSPGMRAVRSRNVFGCRIYAWMWMYVYACSIMRRHTWPYTSSVQKVWDPWSCRRHACRCDLWVHINVPHGGQFCLCLWDCMVALLLALCVCFRSQVLCISYGIQQRSIFRLGEIWWPCVFGNELYAVCGWIYRYIINKNEESESEKGGGGGEMQGAK